MTLRVLLVPLLALAACRNDAVAPPATPLAVPSAPVPPRSDVAGLDTTGLAAAAQAYFQAQGATSGSVIVEAVADSVVRVRVFPRDPNVPDPAAAFLRRTATGWRGLAYGPAFSAGALDTLGIPPAARL